MVTQQYEVKVPYTEQDSQSYTVSVPYTENVPQMYEGLQLPEALAQEIIAPFVRKVDPSGSREIELVWSDSTTQPQNMAGNSITRSEAQTETTGTKGEGLTKGPVSYTHLTLPTKA